MFLASTACYTFPVCIKVTGFCVDGKGSVWAIPPKLAIWVEAHTADPVSRHEDSLFFAISPVLSCIFWTFEDNYFDIRQSPNRFLSPGTKTDYFSLSLPFCLAFSRHSKTILTFDNVLFVRFLSLITCHADGTGSSPVRGAYILFAPVFLASTACYTLIPSAHTLLGITCLLHPVDVQVYIQYPSQGTYTVTGMQMLACYGTLVLGA